MFQGEEEQVLSDEESDSETESVEASTGQFEEDSLLSTDQSPQTTGQFSPTSSVASYSEKIDSYLTLNKLNNYDNNKSDIVYSDEDYQNNSRLSPPGKKDRLRSQESEELDSFGMNLSEVCMSYDVKF